MNIGKAEQTAFITCSLVQLSDCHLTPAEEQLAGVNTQANFLTVLAHAQHHCRADKYLLTGDLAHADAALSLAWLNHQVGQLDNAATWHFLPGNHDDKDLLRSQLGKLNPASEWQQNGWHVLLLDSTTAGPHGELSTMELERIQAVAERADQQPVLLALHHHPVAVNGFIDEHGLKNQAALAELCQRYPNIKVILHGHVHQEVDVAWQGVRVLGCPATSVQFPVGAAEFSVSTELPGYRWINLLANGQIETGVVRVSGAMRGQPEQLGSY